jgi:D-alanyl-D-alanine carboxypeptidase
MPFSPSYSGKTFTIADTDARIRDPNDLAVITAQVIPQGRQVRVAALKTLRTGTKTGIVCANVTATDGSPIGWTSTRNFAGKFINETINLLPKGAPNQQGPNAVWSGGNYRGEVDLVEIIDSAFEIERMTEDTVVPYLQMVAAAAAANVQVAINSGFRSWPEQNALYQGFINRVPGFNKAAPPGYSNHQNGIALDINVTGFGGPTYTWLTQNATSHGFLRTVDGEPWHWEHDPARATVARNQGTFKAPGVTN